MSCANSGTPGLRADLLVPEAAPERRCRSGRPSAGRQRSSSAPTISPAERITELGAPGARDVGERERLTRDLAVCRAGSCPSAPAGGDVAQAGIEHRDRRRRGTRQAAGGAGLGGNGRSEAAGASRRHLAHPVMSRADQVVRRTSPAGRPLAWLRIQQAQRYSPGGQGQPAVPPTRALWSAWLAGARDLDPRPVLGWISASKRAGSRVASAPTEQLEQPLQVVRRTGDGVVVPMPAVRRAAGGECEALVDAAAAPPAGQGSSARAQRDRDPPTVEQHQRRDSRGERQPAPSHGSANDARPQLGD